MQVLHACAHLATSQIGPHYTATHFIKVPNSAEACNALQNTEKSNIECYKVGALREEGKKKTLLALSDVTTVGTIIFYIVLLDHQPN